ncbi:MAG TPA: hypothetical protein VK620_05620 [Bradyrhizobium sp.]|nr:hypothetical protein [Bradyrhizobium sp.]
MRPRLAGTVDPVGCSRASNTLAGSSVGSCGTRRPSKAGLEDGLLEPGDIGGFRVEYG